MRLSTENRQDAASRRPSPAAAEPGAGHPARSSGGHPCVERHHDRSAHRAAPNRAPAGRARGRGHRGHRDQVRPAADSGVVSQHARRPEGRGLPTGIRRAGAIAREAGDDERQAIWDRARTLYAGYAAYASRIKNRGIHIMISAQMDSGSAARLQGSDSPTAVNDAEHWNPAAGPSPTLTWLAAPSCHQPALSADVCAEGGDA
jgi:hypothetical protein